MTITVRKTVEVLNEDGTLNEALNGVVRAIMDAPVGVHMSSNRAIAIANNIAKEYHFVKKDTVALGTIFEHPGE